MARALERECLNCGMLHDLPIPDVTERGTEVYCIKCDSELLTQSDGSRLTRDIAHQQETVSEAERKLLATLNEAWRGYASTVRLIVGGGRIREAVQGQLYYYRSTGVVLDYSEPRGNPGAIVVTLRH